MNQKQVEFPESETTICEIKISMNDISSRVYLHHRLNKNQWSLRHYNRDLLKWGTSRKETENKKKEKEFQETGNYRALKSQRGEAGKKMEETARFFKLDWNNKPTDPRIRMKSKQKKQYSTHTAILEFCAELKYPSKNYVK